MTERERAAHHEAGHCAIAWHFRRRIRRVRIGNDGTGGTICQELRADARSRFSEQRYRELAAQEVKIWSAGAIAEEIFTGTSDADAARVDDQHVRFWLKELRVRAGGLYARFLAGRAKRMLLDPQTAASVRAIAARLLERGELSGGEVHELCRTAQSPANSSPNGAPK